MIPGTRLGAYEITSAIGAGGMGEVYRARDTKLNRDVALKILPSAFASDADRLARFHREAQVLASLNHPHIGGIYGFEDSGETHALVLEFVDGPTLADRIAQGPIPIDEALPIAMQIAEALEAAHEQGIIHRDLKPANIKLRADGTVKVLDFGLAKLNDPNVSNDPNAFSMSPTITSPAMMTGVGTLLGTAAYMAPEQARGKAVDKRADIWAFGAVVYEMLTARQAFSGETVSDTIVSVLSRELDWGALPPDTPLAVRDLLRRCVRREAAHRLRDIGDARLQIEEALSREDVRVTPSSVNASRTGSRRTLIVAIAAALVIGVAGGFGAVVLFPSSPTEPRGWTATLLGGANVAWTPRVSPDGKSIAFLGFVDGLTQVAVMNPDSGNWTVLTKDRTRGYVSRISWSRDGTRIYYNRYTDVPVGVYSVPALGGEERLLLDNANGAEPLSDGTLLVAKINANRQMQLYRYWPTEGRLAPLPGIVTDTENVPVRVFPDAMRAAFRGRSIDQSRSDPRTYVYVLDVVAGTVTRLSGGDFDTGTGVLDASIGIMPDGQSVVVGQSNGDLTRLVELDINNRTPPATLLQLTHQTNNIDIGPDGSVYLNEGIRPADIWRLTPTGSGLERLNSLPDYRLRYGGSNKVLHTREGRTWIAATVGGRERVMVIDPGKEPIPFIETDEETAGPMTLVGTELVALMIGNGVGREVALASVRDGRVVRRVQTPPAATITSMTASRDGRVLYVTSSGNVWSVPMDGGPPKMIHSGDSVTLGGDGRSLVIQLVENRGVRFVQTSLDGTMEEPIRVNGDWHFTFQPLGAGAVAPDGRIVLPISVKDSWFWALGVLDPKTGDVQRIPLPFHADPPSPAWTSDGRIIVVTFSLSASMWRFRPERATR